MGEFIGQHLLNRAERLRACRALGEQHARDDLRGHEDDPMPQADEVAGITELALYFGRRPTDEELDAWGAGYDAEIDDERERREPPERDEIEAFKECCDLWTY